MNIIHSWQNYVLSAVVLLALGLIALSLRQFYQLRGRQPSNKNIQWLIVFSAMLILICVITTGYLLSTVFEPTKIIIASVCLFAGLFVWFSACAGNSIAEELTKAATLEHYYATHDDLTALPNLSSFNHQLEKTLSVSRREEDELALLIIGLNRFKVINETLGYFVGDAILQEIAHRIRVSLRKTDLIARLGGDEFAVLQRNIDGKNDPLRLAEQLISSMESTIHVNGVTVQSGMSVGIARCPENGVDPDELLKNADLALYRAKNAGRGKAFLFDSGMDAEIRTRREMEVEFRRALGSQEICLHYQPILDAKSKEVVSFEALVRWHHPEKGFIDPDFFVPLAEEVGLINPLGEWIIREAFAEAATWSDDVCISVNLSSLQVKNPSLLSTLINTLAQTGLDA
ncbi:MAG: putative bifunctional diguanylate cyclase/phosphodiesterase, partial [Gammaproteobacteria bacterium]